MHSLATRDLLPPVSSAVYSSSMKRIALLNLLLCTLVIEIGSYLFENGIDTTPGMTWRIGFFILVPLALAIFIWLKFRWAAMICVMYATVGLAMDIATLVLTLKQDSVSNVSVVNNAVSGFLYFLLILFGGWSFLDVSQEPTPPESRLPNPLSPS